MYCLEAVIATKQVLSELIGVIPGARIVPLAQHLSLLPMTDALFDAVGVGPRLDGFRKAPRQFGHLLATCSANGPVAYVEADYFGGSGIQSAQVWDSGQVVLGPLYLDDTWEVFPDGERFPDEGAPISQALRRLGVVYDTKNEFDAVRLGRHRDTEDWLPSTS